VPVDLNSAAEIFENISSRYGNKLISSSTKTYIIPCVLNILRIFNRKLLKNIGLTHDAKSFVVNTLM
jgi:hypothetical protein